MMHDALESVVFVGYQSRHKLTLTPLKIATKTPDARRHMPHARKSRVLQMQMCTRREHCTRISQASGFDTLMVQTHETQTTDTFAFAERADFFGPRSSSSSSSNKQRRR